MTIIARPKAGGLGAGAALRTTPWAVVLGPLAALAIALAALVGVQSAYASRALPGVSVAGVAVGSLDGPGVRSRLDSELAGRWAAGRVTLRDGERAWSATNAELAIAADVDAATGAALEYGKTGSAFDRLEAWIAALTGRAQLPLATRASDPDALERWVAQIASTTDRAPVDGEIRLTGQGIALREPADGRRLDRVATTGLLLGARGVGDREIELPLRRLAPAVDETGYGDAAARARAIAGALEITAGDRTVHEDAAGMATLVVVERQLARAAELPAVAPGAVPPSARYRYSVTIDEGRAKAWIAAVAAILDRPPRDAGYTMAPDGTFGVVPGQDGLRVDQAALLGAVMAELPRPLAGPRVIAAPLSVAAPAFTTADAARYAGAMVKIGGFTTYYPANASRHANISTGASQFDQLVIAPGTSFSFWDLLGPVTVERGYAYAGAIIDNRSDENVIGGGLCQVSTTLFNAVARAGYQIDERHNHGYYIDRYPIGLDAAVFEPGVNFRWTNDTSFPVLIRSSGTATSVTFELYSVPTGRTIAFGPAIQSTFTSVRPEQPADPAFAPGYAVQGRDVTTSRTVKAADGTSLHNDVWTSHYVAVWGGPAR